MRLNPNFVTNVFANNLKAIFDYIEGLDTPNQRLEDVGVELQHISLKVISTKNKVYLGHLRWIQHDFPHDIDPHEHPGTHSAVSSRPGQEAAAGTDNATQTNTNVREHACGRRSHPPWMPTAASNEKATSLHSNVLHRHAAEVPDGMPRARIGLALVLRCDRRSGRRDGQNGGHVDGGDGGGHEWGSACEPRAQTCVSIYVRVDGSMSRDVKRMGGRRRAHLCARRRSCRGRWLPTGRSGPRAPGGVGRGSRRPLWPPRLPASARRKATD